MRSGRCRAREPGASHAFGRGETIRQVKAFQHVRATGEATPSGWQPGKKTLKPGPDLVGRVWEVWKPGDE